MQVTKERIEEYLATRTDLTSNTLKTYSNRLYLLYDNLPEDKEIQRGTIQTVSDKLLKDGYSKQMVNVLLSAADRFVVWAGQPELQAVYRYESENNIQPELSRTEYQRLLMAAKHLGREREYLFIKTIALTGVNLQELLAITAEDIENGWVKCESEQRRIPRILREELMAYITRSGTNKGPVFKAYRGTTISRGSITHAINSLAKTARVDEEKCNPRCLRKLYLDTQEKYREMLQSLVDSAQERQLENEQRVVGWNV